jgi:2-C-methyl-D-erythritol 4-phosphate cytidylyltransferase
VAVALLVAAGSGERLGADLPKAFVTLGGETLLARSLRAIREAGIEEVVVALPAGHETPPGVRGVRGVPGGAVRSASVLAALAASTGDPVVVHDAARPLAPPELFRSVLGELERSGADGAVAAAPVTDTVKRAREGDVVETLDRSELWAIQTPQAFRRVALERALDVDETTLAAATDDAWLVERAGGTVRVVAGPPDNLKITTPRDLRIAEALLGC